MAWRRGQAYSQDLRERILASEGTAASVAGRFGVSISYVVKARQRRARHGQVCVRPQRSHTPAKLAAHDEALRKQVRREPDWTLAELTAWAAAELRVRVSTTAMWTRLRRLRLTLKKRPSLPPSRRVRISPKRVVRGRR